jgi:hypothetical protein
MITYLNATGKCTNFQIVTFNIFLTTYTNTGVLQTRQKFQSSPTLTVSFALCFTHFYQFHLGVVSAVLFRFISSSEDKHLHHLPSTEPSLTTKASAIGINGQSIPSPWLSHTLNQLCASQWWIIQEHGPNDRSEIWSNSSTQLDKNVNFQTVVPYIKCTLGSVLTSMLWQST